jgi:2-(1,2-epoxy-1,2-dihydrophenyl)acetyl-CoA isomerase
MQSSELLVRADEGVCTVTLNRPEARNALTPAMAAALVHALRAAADDPRIRAVVLTGAGRAFCAGGDVKAMAAGRDTGLSTQARAQALVERAEASRLLSQMPKPTVALLRGAAAGAGLSLALACDFRLAVIEAKLTTAFARVGLSGDYGISGSLPRLVGLSRAKELLMLSPVLEAPEAHRMGLLDRVWPTEAFDAQAATFVDALARGPTVAFGAIKANLARCGGWSHETLDFESANQAACTMTADHREAALAFADKRTPVFLGH